MTVLETHICRNGREYRLVKHDNGQWGVFVSKQTSLIGHRYDDEATAREHLAIWVGRANTELSLAEIAAQQ